jgi:flagellar motor switch protein FliN/FliY
MSDGALSQAEIDALLAGVDSSGGADTATMDLPSEVSEEARKALESFFSSTVDAQSSNLSMMTSGTVSMKGPEASFTDRETLLGQLPDMITVVKADFSSGFPGEHFFIMGEITAKSIAGLMNKEDNIELDEMAMSVIGEAVGTIVGAQITALTGKTGNKSIANMPPESANVPKAVAALPAGNFFVGLYQLDLGDGQNHQIWEILGPTVASEIAQALNGGAPAKAGGSRSMSGLPGMGNINGGGMGMASGMGSGGLPGGIPSNVQAVQFPTLMPHPTPQEAGNIGLIMDVFMEMTVELGRTRKLIKEILGMGEGTIIELDKLAGEPVDILVNHKLIAKGEVVVIDENFGVRVTEIVSPMERMSDMG